MSGVAATVGRYVVNAAGQAIAEEIIKKQDEVTDRIWDNFAKHTIHTTKRDFTGNRESDNAKKREKMREIAWKMRSKARFRQTHLGPDKNYEHVMNYNNKLLDQLANQSQASSNRYKFPKKRLRGTYKPPSTVKTNRDFTIYPYTWFPWQSSSTSSRRSSVASNVDTAGGSQFSYNHYRNPMPYRRRFAKKRFRRPFRRSFPRRRRFYRRYGKGKQLARRLFTKARSIYNKKKKPQRLFNTGKMSLMKNISTGGRLPFETSAVLFYRIQEEQAFENYPQNNRDRTVKMNSMRLPLANLQHVANGIELNKYQWIQTLRSLYQEYCVTGCKLLIEIKPTMWPANFRTAQKTVDVPEGGEALDMCVPSNVTSGYWYVRVFYRKKDLGTYSDSSMEVGAFMNTGVADTHAAIGTERIWKTRRDFLSDPTVSYVRDRTVVREKIRGTMTAPAMLSGGEGGIGTTWWSNTHNAGEEQKVEYEVEKQTKTVVLKQFYSYKKHTGDKNWRNNIRWSALGTHDLDIQEPPLEERFQVRVGYIGFTNNGVKSFHVPVDRHAWRNVTYSMTSRVRLRKPRIGPDGTITPLQQTAMQEYLTNSYGDHDSGLVETTAELEKPESMIVELDTDYENDSNQDSDSNDDWSESSELEEESVNQQKLTDSKGKESSVKERTQLLEALKDQAYL